MTFKVFYNLVSSLLNFVGFLNWLSTLIIFSYQFLVVAIATYSLGNWTDTLSLLWLFQNKSFLWCPHTTIWSHSKPSIAIHPFWVHLQGTDSKKKKPVFLLVANYLSFWEVCDISYRDWLYCLAVINLCFSWSI